MPNASECCMLGISCGSCVPFLVFLSSSHSKPIRIGPRSLEFRCLFALVCFACVHWFHPVAPGSIKFGCFPVTVEQSNLASEIASPAVHDWLFHCHKHAVPVMGISDVWTISSAMRVFSSPMDAFQRSKLEALYNYIHALAKGFTCDSL